MSVKLYEMTQAYKSIWDMVEDEETDLTQLEQALQSLEGDIKDKLDSMAQIVKGTLAEADYIKEEKKRLDTKKQALENKADRLKRYMQEQMELVGLDKVKGTHYTVGIQNNPPALNVVDESLIPKLFYIVPDPVLDKDTIKAMLKEGQEIPGVELKQGRSLRIR